MKFLKSFFVLIIFAAINYACTNDNQEITSNESSTFFNKDDITLSFKSPSTKSSSTLSIFQQINASLDGYEIAQVEIYGAPTSAGDVDAVTVIPIPSASSTDYRTGFRFFPNDPRRDNRNNLTYVTVSEFATSANGVASEDVFDDMYNIWENETYCNTVSINKQAFSLAAEGLPSTILSFGGEPLGPVADHNIIGFIPDFLFQAIGAPPGVLAVNFSFAFIDENGNRTDTNNDGKFDTSHTETWFNDGVLWSTDGATGTFDINSVALHEFGHSVGHGHSGTLLASFDENGQFTGDLQYTPRNVMNASYIGPKTSLSGDDQSIYCENFSAWPYY